MKLLILLTPFVPLALACLIFIVQSHVRLRNGLVRLAPLSLLPALLAGLYANDYEQAVDALLLGVQWGLDDTGRIFLLFSAIIWLFALIFSQAWLMHDPHRVRFAGFMLTAAAGNLGLCVAQDVVSFYWLFALMTFSAWALVLHRADKLARQAGTVYLVLAVFGETALLVALLLIVSAGGMSLAEVPAVVAASPWRNVIMLLLLLGFGVKTGVLGLHVSLPLAYAATPVPGAAVLGSAMLKAGLLGWLRFLPIGHVLPEWGILFMVLGFAAAFYGVVIGVLQTQPKSLLAYSSISQMGLITAGLGLGLHSAMAASLVVVVLTLYALHHAVVKAVLFLGEGLQRSVQGRIRVWVIVGLVLAALVLAGVPMTSGALAKAGLSQLVMHAGGSQVLSNMLLLASIGTTLLMARWLWLIWRAREVKPSDASAIALLTWTGLVLFMFFGAWWLTPGSTAPIILTGWGKAMLPIIIGVVLAIAGGWLLRGRDLKLAAGDVLWPVLTMARYSWSRLHAGLRWLRRKTPEQARTASRFRPYTYLMLPFDRLEFWLRRYSTGVGLLLVVGLMLLFAIPYL